MKKNTGRALKIGSICVLALALICAAAFIYHRLNTVAICGEEFDKSVSAIDLSGRQLAGEANTLLKLSHLKYADLTDTGITPEQYDTIHAALPDCSIRWSVPIRYTRPKPKSIEMKPMMIPIFTMSFCFT